jgi:hypothetical protein
MKHLRQHIIFRYLWLVVALNILNFSIDAPDPHIQSVQEDLSINDMESIVEIVLEKMLGLDDALAENDEQENENSFQFKQHLDYFVLSYIIIPQKIKIIPQIEKTTSYKPYFLLSFYPDICPPPPKV